VRSPRVQAEVMMMAVDLNEFKENLPGRVMISHRSIESPISVYNDVMPAKIKDLKCIPIDSGAVLLFGTVFINTRWFWDEKL
jgi:hypothetical protein